MQALMITTLEGMVVRKMSQHAGVVRYSELRLSCFVCCCLYPEIWLVSMEMLSEISANQLCRDC